MLRSWLAHARGNIDGTPPMQAIFGRTIRSIPPLSRCHSASVKDSDWHVEGGFYEKYATINHVIAPECGAYKKNNKMATVSARTIK